LTQGIGNVGSPGHHYPQVSWFKFLIFKHFDV